MRNYMFIKPNEVHEKISSRIALVDTCRDRLLFLYESSVFGWTIVDELQRITYTGKRETLPELIEDWVAVDPHFRFVALMTSESDMTNVKYSQLHKDTAKKVKIKEPLADRILGWFYKYFINGNTK